MGLHRRNAFTSYSGKKKLQRPTKKHISTVVPVYGCLWLIVVMFIFWPKKLKSTHFIMLFHGLFWLADRFLCHMFDVGQTKTQHVPRDMSMSDLLYTTKYRLCIHPVALVIIASSPHHRRLKNEMKLDKVSNVNACMCKACNVPIGRGYVKKYLRVYAPVLWHLLACRYVVWAPLRAF